MLEGGLTWCVRGCVRGWIDMVCLRVGGYGMLEGMLGGYRRTY